MGNESISEDNIWYLMKRASSDTRGRLPSNPAVYAWPMSTNAGVATWVVPEGFSCPNGRGVGRWLWKTGNSCNDVHNVGLNTETFVLEEFLALGGLQLGACEAPCETFLTCFDFTTAVGPSPPPPPPTPPPPAPLGPCHSISPLASDDWCQTNCHYVGAECPADLCKCDPLPPTPFPPTPPIPHPTPAPMPPAPTPAPMPPTPPTPAPPGQCRALSPVVSDTWCTSNCHASPPYCPADLCSCDKVANTQWEWI